MIYDPKKQLLALVLAVLFGILLGVFGTLLALRGSSAPQKQGGRGGGTPAQQDDLRAQIATVHFMKKFTAALVGEPDNIQPNPGYRPLLATPEVPLVCNDCHSDSTLDMDRMLAMDPGAAAVDPYRRDPGFMERLMTDWVERLNTRHRDRLTKTVTCTDCHAIDPRDVEERVRVYRALMISFVNALRERPTNANAATDWKPLLKDPGSESMLCAACHGEAGETLEQNLARFDRTRPLPWADNKVFMVHLMERWTERLNMKAGHLLRKAVVCRDCHQIDPRR